MVVRHTKKMTFLNWNFLLYPFLSKLWQHSLSELVLLNSPTSSTALCVFPMQCVKLCSALCSTVESFFFFLKCVLSFVYAPYHVPSLWCGQSTDVCLPLSWSSPRADPTPSQYSPDCQTLWKMLSSWTKTHAKMEAHFPNPIFFEQASAGSCAGKQVWLKECYLEQVMEPTALVWLEPRATQRTWPLSISHTRTDLS